VKHNHSKYKCFAITKRFDKDEGQIVDMKY